MHDVFGVVVAFEGSENVSAHGPVSVVVAVERASNGPSCRNGAVAKSWIELQNAVSPAVIFAVTKY